MLKTILVPLDGSELAEVALGHAAQLSIPTGAKLLLVRVASSHTLPGVDARERKEGAIFEAEDYLTGTAARLIDRGYKCQAVVPYGRAADCIVEQARMSNAGLIVMSTHGRTGAGHVLLGSVAESVVSHSAVPVLVTRGSMLASADELVREKPVFIVPLDGSAFAETALEPAIHLADDFGAALLLVRAQTPDAQPMSGIEYLRRAEAKLRNASPDLTVDVDVRYGGAAQSIDEAYSESGASLVIMATHGRSGVLRSVLGSVAGKVVKDGRAPVVLIRPPAYVEEIAKEQHAAEPTSAG
jgi:nucleotide-binding universal stress UspA family protein